MGLIKAGIGALGGTLADQWKEFFYCESMPKEVLVTKGQKRVAAVAIFFFVLVGDPGYLLS